MKKLLGVCVSLSICLAPTWAVAERANLGMSGLFNKKVEVTFDLYDLKGKLVKSEPAKTKRASDGSYFYYHLEPKRSNYSKWCMRWLDKTVCRSARTPPKPIRVFVQ